MCRIERGQMVFSPVVPESLREKHLHYDYIYIYIYLLIYLFKLKGEGGACVWERLVRFQSGTGRVYVSELGKRYI